MKYSVPKFMGSIQNKDEKPSKKAKAVDGSTTLNVSKRICKFRHKLKNRDRKYFCEMHRRKESKCNACAIEDLNRLVRIIGKHDA